MSDNEESLFMSDLEADDDTTEMIKREDQEPMSLWNCMPGNSIDLCSDDDIPNVKQEAIDNFRWDSFKNRVVEISDSEDEETFVKTEPKDSRTPRKVPQTETIMLADKDGDEDIIILDDGSMVPVKKEAVEVPFDWRPMPDHPIDVEASLGSALFGPGRKAVRRQLDPEKLKQCSQMFARKSLEQRKASGANAIFTQPQTQPQPVLPSSPKPLRIDEDGLEWMSSEVIPDDVGPAETFHKLREVYRAKKRTHTNSFEDDVEYKRAQMKEKERAKRVAENAADNKSDESMAEESEGGLFDSGILAGTKRSFHDYDDGEEPQPNLSSSSTKQAKRNEPIVDPGERRARARAYKKEWEREERYNRMAGVESILLRDQLKRERRAAKEAEKRELKSKKGRVKKTIKATPATRKLTTKKTMANIASLFDSNIYDDPNADVDMTLLPPVSEKRKLEFLSSLTADIPKEDMEEAKRDQRDILQATRVLMRYGVSHDGKGQWVVKGMESSLYHHQVQGAAAMKKRELSARGPFGGILADSMGLGKTVITIATMVAHRQRNPDEPKCTLIVCSPALIQQWLSELKTHVDQNTFQVINRFRGREDKDFDSKGVELQMEGTDILLTTYGEVIRSYPKLNLPQDLKDREAKLAWWEKEWDANRGLLHRAHFFRVVLDEAQIIKNHLSQTSIACRALMARHRWAISGTPIQNRLEELFPYFKFLRVPHTGSIGIFRQNYCLKDSEVCNKRLVSIISGIMIRRMGDDRLLGHRLLVLPKNHQTTIPIHFNKVERYIYKNIRLRCIRAINAAAKDREFDKTAQMVMIMFQRLRQMTSHIFMVQEVIEKEFDHISWEDILEEIFSDFEDSDVGSLTDIEQAMVTGLKRMIAEKGQKTDEPDLAKLFTCDDETAEKPEDEPQTKAKASKNPKSLLNKYAKYLKYSERRSKAADLKEKKLCQYCHKTPKEPHVTSCYHLYCKNCLHILALEAAQKDQDQALCFKCEHRFSESAPCEGLKELESVDYSAPFLPERKRASTSEDPGAETGFKLTMKYVDSSNQLMLSSKLIAVKEEIFKSLEEEPDRKIIVFTDWYMVMHLMGKVCKQEGWNCCHYNGKIPQNMRPKILEAFSNDPSIKILIASLKCGGTGLNLTAASKVICVDLWFNSYVEQQAFSRVHRIGQTRETYITRFQIADTVDESLINMQEEKSRIIGAALDDRSVLATLKPEELMSLFGPVGHDENSRPFILVDDEEMLGEKKKQRKKATEKPGIEKTAPETAAPEAMAPETTSTEQIFTEGQEMIGETGIEGESAADADNGANAAV